MEPAPARGAQRGGTAADAGDLGARAPDQAHAPAGGPPRGAAGGREGGGAERPPPRALRSGARARALLGPARCATTLAQAPAPDQAPLLESPPASGKNHAAEARWPGPGTAGEEPTAWGGPHWGGVSLGDPGQGLMDGLGGDQPLLKALLEDPAGSLDHLPALAWLRRGTGGRGTLSGGALGGPPGGLEDAPSLEAPAPRPGPSARPRPCRPLSPDTPAGLAEGGSGQAARAQAAASQARHNEPALAGGSPTLAGAEAGALERLAAATPWANPAWGAALRRGHLGAVPGSSRSPDGAAPAVAGPQLDLDWRGLLAMDAAPATAWDSHADSSS